VFKFLCVHVFLQSVLVTHERYNGWKFIVISAVMFLSHWSEQKFEKDVALFDES
jgi:hypothetical protein